MTVSMYLTEQKIKHYQSLVKAIKELLQQPAIREDEKQGARFVVRNNELQATLHIFVLRMSCTEILPVVRVRHHTCDPAFVFLDPFGWKGYPRAFIDNLKQHFTLRCDIIVNFMSSSIHRGKARRQNDSSLKALVYPQDYNSTDHPFNASKLVGKEDKECLEYYVETYFNEVNRLPAEQQIYPVRLAVRCTKIKYHLLLLSFDPMARILMKQAILRRRITAYDQRHDVFVYEESKPASVVYRRHDKDAAELIVRQFGDLNNREEIKRFVENHTPFLWSDALIAEALRVDRTRLPPVAPRYSQTFFVTTQQGGMST
ncbi:hypothetical protein QOT17_010556 [Balamuthia mandrillaris]